MKIKEIRGLENRTLDEKLLELKNELIKINAQIAIGTTPKNPGQVKSIKKSIARIIGVKYSKINSKKSVEAKKIVKDVSKRSEVAKTKKSLQPPSKNLEVVGNKVSGPSSKKSEVEKKHE